MRVRTSSKGNYFGLCFILTVGLSACMSTGHVPIATNEPEAPVAVSKSPPAPPTKSVSPDIGGARAGYHVVAAGETLYSIAWRYGQDYRDVARWNRIYKPYVIHPGQVVRLTPPKINTTPQHAAAKKTTTHPKPARTHPPVKPKASTSKAKKKTQWGPISWQWPAKGSLFKSNSLFAERGLDITGRFGEAISAAAPGQVVYSGGGLIGYGKLIIIKHSETYLSAYAHNSKVLVKEGDRVRTGQHIASMGRGTNGQAMLHFEIRQNGKPVDPLRYLPKRQL